MKTRVDDVCTPHFYRNLGEYYGIESRHDPYAGNSYMFLEHSVPWIVAHNVCITYNTQYEGKESFESFCKSFIEKTILYDGDSAVHKRLRLYSVKYYRSEAYEYTCYFSMAANGYGVYA